MFINSFLECPYFLLCSFWRKIWPSAYFLDPILGRKMQNITFCKPTYRCKCVYQYQKYISRNCLPVDEWRIDVKQDLLSIEMNHIGKSGFYVMDAVGNVCSISSLDCKNAMLALFAAVSYIALKLDLLARKLEKDFLFFTIWCLCI